MEPDTRARRVICGVTETDLEEYNAKLLAEGWIIERITPYQDSPSGPIYYRIVTVEAQRKS